jgi:hypothetical protein
MARLGIGRFRAPPRRRYQAAKSIFILPFFDRSRLKAAAMGPEAIISLPTWMEGSRLQLAARRHYGVSFSPAM